MSSTAYSVLFFLSAFPSIVAAEDAGPQAVLRYELAHRGDLCVPDARQCYPNAKPIAFSETKHFRVLTSELWTPRAIVEDLKRRSANNREFAGKKAILVVLKTERCATKEARLCSTVTAAIEKRSTELLEQFEVYGLELLPRDGDDPPGSKPIEKGGNAWKNDAVREYGFIQGPGATIVCLSTSGEVLGHTDAVKLRLWEKELIANAGRTPELEAFLSEMLAKVAGVRANKSP